MRRAPLRALLLCSLTLYALLAAVPAAAEPLRATGTRTWLELPPGFRSADDFSGFVADEPRASIAISELPASFVDAFEAYSDEGLARKGLEVTRRHNIELDGLRAVIIEGEQRVGSALINKLLMLTGDTDDTLSITATYRSAHAGHYRAPLLQTLRTAIWNPSLPLNLFDGLGFRLSDVPGLRVATRAGNNIVFTSTGQLPDPYYTGPFLAAGWSPERAPGMADHSRFAREQFKRMARVNAGIIDDVGHRRIGEREAIITRGHGIHSHLGYEVSAYQIVVVFAERYLVAQGICDSRERDRVFDLFDAVLSSLLVDPR